MNPSSRLLQMPSPQKGMSAFMFYIDDWRQSWAVEAMDDHEKVAYLNLLMRAASNPDCGLPDNDFELAVISGLGTRWFKPTRDRNKRLQKQNTDGTFSPKSSGEKLRECFSFCPKTAQLPVGRLFNERLYAEFVRKQEVSYARSEARRGRGRGTNGETEPDNCSFLSPSETTNVQQTPPHLPPTNPVYIEANHQPPANVDREEEAGFVSQNASEPKPQTPGNGTGTRPLPETPADGYAEFQEHCKNSHLPVGSRKLWQSLRKKFPHLTTAQVIESLPVFVGQTSPGLWNHHGPKELIEESERQRNPQRIPAASESPMQKILRELNAK